MEEQHPNSKISAEQLELREPATVYNRNKEIPTFFGEPMLKGSFSEVNLSQALPDVPTLFYNHPNGKIWIGEAMVWLRSLEGESVDLIFADPPYNIKKAEWDTFESQENI
jgi:site-specific DNA-methyltransferase (adenine-specific)